MQKNKTTLMKATDLLARQEQSSKTLKRKLLAQKYDEAEIDAAIDKLKSHNYLNDEEACRRQFEIFYEEGRLSVRQICGKLIQRGFDSAFVQNLVPEDTDEHERRAAIRALQKKFSPQNFDGENLQAKLKFKNKLWQHLASKGFDSETISLAVDIFLDDDGD